MPTRSRRRPALVMGLVALLALMAGQTGVFAYFQGTATNASPATGHAEVIAHGVAQLPAARVAWKVSNLTAKVVADEPLANYALGFAYAQTDPIVVNDYDTGAQTQLASGQAVFVADGAAQQHASLGSGNASYTEISLVAEADAPNPNNVFAAPTGSRAINLVRDVLGQGEKTSIADTGAPILIVAGSGSITVTSSAGTQTLKPGAVGVFSGDVSIAQTGTGNAIFVAATIGDQIPAAPRFSGTVTLQIFGCPAGTTVASLPAAGASGANPCAAISSGVDLTLKTPSGKDQTLADATSVKTPAGAFRWTALPFGTYEVQAPTTLPSGYSDVVFVGSDNSILKTASAKLSRTNPDVTIALYLMTGDTGKITANVLDCPPGMDAASFNASLCTDTAPSGFDITVSSDALTGGDLTLADSAQSGDSYVWSKLPLATSGTDGATYTIAEDTLPTGFNDYTVDGASGGSGAPWTVALSSTTPSASITIYNLQGTQTSGFVTVDALVCPATTSAATDCTRPITGPVGLSGVFIDGPETLTNANATQTGNSPFAWVSIPFGTYTMTDGNLAPPTGYEVFKVETTDGTDPAAGFTLSANDPIANIIVFLAPTSSSATPVATP